MANLTNIENWESGIYQLEQTDPVQAGPGGIDNLQAQQLSNRTNWLKKYTDQFGVTQGVQISDDVNNAKQGMAYAFGAANMPTGNNGQVWTSYYQGVASSGYGTQLFMEHDFDRVFQRRLFNGVWQGWKELSVGAIGMIAMFPGNSVPFGWLKCNGASISRTTFYPLFLYASTLTDGWVSEGSKPQYKGRFGYGDNVSTFTLPDLRGYFVRGFADGSGGIDAGRIIGTTQDSAVGSHYHLLFGSNAGGTLTSATGASEGHLDGGNAGYIIKSSSGAASVGRSGLTGDTETRPHNIAMNFYIKF